MSKTKLTVKNKTNPKMKNAAGANVVMSAAMYSGPLPPPAHFQEYERILPGAAERLLTMAEKQQNYTHKIEEKALEAEVHFKTENFKYFSRGQSIALFITLISFVLVYFLALAGHDKLAGTIAITTLGTLATAFIYGSKNKKSS